MNNPLTPLLPMLLALLALSFADEASSATVGVDLAWDHPEQRANGDALSPDELAGYEIEIKTNRDRATVIDIGVQEAYTDEFNYEPGPLEAEYRIRSEGEHGLKSKWSDWEAYTTEVKPEAAPATPVLRIGSGG